MTTSPVQPADPLLSPVPLPTMYDLPSEDPEEPGLPDEFHLWQPNLLSDTFSPSNYPADRIFVASDLNLYYDPQHPRWYKRPDWFAVVGVSRFYEGRDLRLSYVIWQEKVSPIVAVELLSPSTRREDLGQRQRRGKKPTKWEVYEQILNIPYYVLFDRYTDELRAFTLIGGCYQPLDVSERKVWISQLNMGLALWQGTFRGQDRQWLRWYNAEGNWLLTEAEQERQRAEQERQQKELALQRAEQLAAKLKALGIDPDSLAE